ncbi:helix-turn-helix domain-containing protein [Paenibacillus tarimensis]
MIGERLRALRKANNMTQEQLAKIINSAKSTVSQYENNINEPDIETIMKLADCFGVSVDHLLGRDVYANSGSRTEENSLLMERLTEDEESYLKESLEMYRKWRDNRRNR